MNEQVCIGIVSPWPTVKNAEYEVIERMKIAITAMGHHWAIVDGNGRLLSASRATTPADTVSKLADFCISMHFVSPKLWEPYTYLAMWNPPRYYHDSNYNLVMSHVGSYDDFLIYHSTPIKDHLLNFLRGTKKNLDGAIEFFSGGAGDVYPVLEKFPVNPKLFYCGINWEKLSGTNGRHHELLTKLDEADCTRIYGPEVFEGVKPWAGFKTYQGSISFDGVSIFKKLRESGIALVLSSNDHVMSEAASNRVYEAINAGVVVLSDRNPFVIKEFGDSVYYFNYGTTWDETYQNIRERLAWILSHQDEALSAAKKAQIIYRERHTLEASLKRLISGHRARLALYEDRHLSRGSGAALVVLPFRSQSEAQIRDQLLSLNKQTYPQVKVRLVADEKKWHSLQGFLKGLPLQVEWVQIESNIPGFNLPKHKLGSFYSEGWTGSDASYLAMMAENEIYHPHHISSLVRNLEDEPAKSIACSGSYLFDVRTGKNEFSHCSIDLGKIFRIVRLRDHDISYSALFRISKDDFSNDFIRLLGFLDSHVVDAFMIDKMKRAGSPLILKSSNIVSSHFCLQEENSKKSYEMTKNYLSDFVCHDDEYAALILKTSDLKEMISNASDLRKAIIGNVRRRIEGKFFYPLIRWMYRRFIVKRIY